MSCIIASQLEINMFVLQPGNDPSAQNAVRPVEAVAPVDPAKNKGEIRIQSQDAIVYFNPLYKD